MHKDVFSACRAARWGALLALLATTACAHRPVTPNDLVRFEPPLPGMEDIWLTGESSGRLAYRGGCFRLEHSTLPGDVTILWPHDYRAVVRSDGRHGVMDTEGNVAFAGEWVRLGGGGGSEILPERVVRRDIALACGGPYASGWLPF